MKTIIALFSITLLTINIVSGPANMTGSFDLWQVERHTRIIKIMNTIKYIESRGNYSIRGASGEYGAYQYMPGTWDYWSIELFGEILDITIPEMQDYMTYCRIEQYINQGYSNKQIASLWNSQKPDWEGRIGVNRWGVPYNVPLYVKTFINKLNS